jgi:hypothetical protein
LVLGDVDETIYVVDDEDEDEEVKVSTCMRPKTGSYLAGAHRVQTINRKSEMLFVRGTKGGSATGFLSRTNFH